MVESRNVDCSNVRVVNEGTKVCFANRDMIFTGDAYISGCKVVMNFPHSNKALVQPYVERILRLAEGKSQHLKF